MAATVGPTAAEADMTPDDAFVGDGDYDTVR
jgi:hypothetical protein